MSPVQPSEMDPAFPFWHWVIAIHLGRWTTWLRESQKMQDRQHSTAAVTQCQRQPQWMGYESADGDSPSGSVQGANREIPHVYRWKHSGHKTSTKENIETFVLLSLLLWQKHPSWKQLGEGSIYLAYTSRSHGISEVSWGGSWLAGLFSGTLICRLMFTIWTA